MCFRPWICGWVLMGLTACGSGGGGPANSAPKPCSTSNPCTAPLKCVSNTCQAGCATNADCTSPEVCNVTTGACQAGCTTNADCTSPEVCNVTTGACQAGCATNADCGIWQMCRNGSCLDPADDVGKIYMGAESANNNIASFESSIGVQQLAVVGDYTNSDGNISGVIKLYATQPNSTVLVSWNLTMTNNQVADGSKDSYLKSQAAAAKAYGKPLFLRLDWEFNGEWYGNYDTAGGVTPAMYVASWRHAHDIFAAAGVTNVAWVWCPNAGDESNPTHIPVSAWYPGDGYVDWIAVDAYPEGSTEAVFVYGTDHLQDIANMGLAHHKPVMLAEFGPDNVNGTHADDSAKLGWIFDWALANPKSVRALLYFNFNNWMLSNNHPNWTAAYQQFITSNATKLVYSLQ